MNRMSFPQDDSIQLDYTDFGFTPTILDNFTTSNYVLNISNLLINNINTKQPILTASTSLLGIGSAITDIDYNKITINKPSNFQSDWNSTVINKPSTFPPDMTNIYTKGETDSLVNAKQDTLTAATTLLGTGGSITGINFNTVINKPTYSSPLSSNVSTNVISVDLSSKQDTLTAATNLLGIGGSITGINFNTVINKPTYSLPLSSNVSTNVISVDLSSKQDTLTAATNLLGIGSAITAIDYEKITINKPSTFPADMTNIYNKTETDTLLNAKKATLTFNIPLIRTTNTIELNQSLISYNNLADRPTIYTQSQIDTLLNTKQNTLTADTILLGIGSAITDLDYNKITINKPSTFPADMTDIYTKTETNNLLNAKEVILTFSSPIIRTTNTISLNQSLIDFNNLLNKPDMNLYLLKSGGTISGNLTIPTGTLNFGNRTDNFIINLWATNEYGFGINSGMMRYNSMGRHTFFSGTTERIDFSSTGVITCQGINVNGALTIQDGQAINFGAGGTDGRIYRSGGQVYIEADDIIYFRSIFANNNITFNQGSVSIPGSLSGANNVCKRASFTFTPALVNVIGIGLRYTQTINLFNYMNSANYGSTQYTFRIHIWTSTGDYGDSTNNVETIGFYVHLSNYAGGKIRINTIYNNSNGSTIGYNSANSIFYNGWNGTGGASAKVCIIENISSF